MTLRTTNGKMKFNCPHCDAPQDDTVGDYVIPNRIGDASRARHDCYDCEKKFTVVWTGQEFVVEKR